MFLKISRNFSIFAFSLLIFAVAATALAVDYQPLVKIPCIIPPCIVAGTSLTGYLSGLYNFLISIVGILAMGVIIYGGMRYVVSAGNPAAMEDAKEAIWSAVYGLVLALGSWLIINIVNPDILVLKNPGVGLPGGKYGYVNSQNNCVASPLGDGTAANPCSCIDGNKNVLASYGNIATAITLTVTPTSVVVPGAINIAGTLKDGAGVPLPAGTPFVLTRANLSFNGSRTPVPLATGAGGGFNLVAVPMTSCNFVESWEVIYYGDATHTPSGSGPVIVTATGAGTNCDGAAYVITPATPFFSLNGCNTICSNPLLAQGGQYHCLKADLRVGKTKDDRTHSSITAKKDETLYFDADTFVRHNYPIVAYAMNYENNFVSLFTFEKSCEVIPLPIGCRFTLTLGTSPPMNDLCDGINGNEHKYTATGVYRAMSRVWEQLPDGSCKTKDAEIPITIENY